jgi:hypothetical protein
MRTNSRAHSRDRTQNIHFVYFLPSTPLTENQIERERERERFSLDHPEREKERSDPVWIIQRKRER